MYVYMEMYVHINICRWAVRTLNFEDSSLFSLRALGRELRFFSNMSVEIHELRRVKNVTPSRQCENAERRSRFCQHRFLIAWEKFERRIA
jgi:hypothetical protein